MDNVKKIMNVMEQIEYGFLDNNGNNIFNNVKLESLRVSFPDACVVAN